MSGLRICHDCGLVHDAPLCPDCAALANELSAACNCEVWLHDRRHEPDCKVPTAKFQIRYRPGTALADQWGTGPCGSYPTRAEAEEVWRACVNQEWMEVVES